MHWSRRCTREVAPTVWFITAIAAPSICPFATPSGCLKLASNPPLAVGDSYDNALAETIIGLYKTEVIHRCGPWRNIDEVEYATLEWVDWFNNRRLLESIGNIPPIEFEQAYYEQLESQAMAA
jgi:hypothetical protein